MVLFLDALMGYVVEKSDSLATALYNRVWCSLTYKIGGLLGLACAGMCCGGREGGGFIWAGCSWEIKIAVVTIIGPQD